MVTKKETTPARPDARERLLDAALALFTRQGYAAASVREICAAAGVTKPVLYYYFGSKEGLYLHLMEGAYALFESRIAQWTSVPGSVRQRLIHFCEGVLDTCDERKSIVRLILSIYYGPPQGAPPFNLERFFDTMLEVVSGLVREGMSKGEIRQGEVNDMTWVLVSCLNTSIEEHMCHADPRIDRSAMGRMLNLIFDGLAVR
jgi:TetR/AcrR family transcriptional regulator